MRKESGLEARLFKGVKRAGGMPIKLTTRTGIPDRLVVLPGGRVVFVELKDEGYSTSAIQKHVQSQLRDLGASVYVLTGKSELDQWLEEISNVRTTS